MASLRKAEAKLRAATPVLSVRKGRDRLGHYIDIACQAFHDSIWRTLGADYDVQMRASYFKPENKKRASVDAIVYRVYVHTEAVYNRPFAERSLVSMRNHAARKAAETSQPE
jgi:hypothetical protein